MANHNILPLLAFQHHVGSLYIDPNDIEFVTELGVGDLAIVEQGRWHRSDGKPSVCSVVVKGYKPFVISSAVDFRELLLESSKLYRLAHPNIARFLGLGCFSHGSLAEVRESMFMVEEYVGTRTLRKLIGEQMRCRLKNLYDMRTALRWAAETASALATLHEQQPPDIHGDVKSDNVFLTDGENLKRVIAKLGDLKPHRHVYDQEPSTLTQHRERVSVKQIKQSSLSRFSLERSSCSSTSWGSQGGGCTKRSSSIADIGGSMHASWHDTPGALQQPEQTAAALHNSGSWNSDATAERWGSEAIERTGSESASILGAIASSCHQQRSRSKPVPIAASCGRLDSAGSCPLSLDSGTCHSLVSVGEVHGSAACLETSRSMPMPSCLRASEMVEAANSKAAAAAAGCDAAAATAAAAAASKVGIGRRRNRAICLSDSASSTTSTDTVSMGLNPAVELVSLAAAGDEDEEGDAEIGGMIRKVKLRPEQSTSSCRSSSDSASPTALEERRDQDSKCDAVPEAWDCSAHNACKVATFLRAESMPNRAPEEQEALFCADDSQQRRKQSQLTTSLSAPAACCDSEVHQGHLVMPLSASLAERCAAVEAPFRQQQHYVKLLQGKRSADPPEKQQQQQQLVQQQQDSMCFGWELSPSGAASPCGAVHSVMLDLFADMAEEEVVLTRRLRDQYTLTPGSFVQHRMLPGSQSLKPCAAWEPACTSSLGTTGSNSQPTIECASSLKGGAPSAMESKQHGSNSAFAALTAIDCIREETSSIATDSVMGSCPPSRETSAHSGVHYYRDIGLATDGADKDQADSSSLLSKSPGHTAGLAALLPLRTVASNNSDSTSSTIDEATTTPVVAATTDEEQAFSAAAAGSTAASAPHSNSSVPASLQAQGSYGDDSMPLPADVNADSRSSSGADAQVATASSSPMASAASADVRSPSAVKRVRFTVERAAGTTPSRDISLLYAAPELLNGQRPTEKVDVFAFGVVLYELLSRSLLISHCAAAVGRNRSRSGCKHGSRKGGRHSPGHNASVHSATAGFDGPATSGDSEGKLPEQELLLAYAQMVAGGYRPPFPPHFPATICSLISGCWSAEPHERPRMADVLIQLQAWGRDKQLVQRLDSYLAGLANMGYGPSGRQGPECACGCVIC